MYTLPRTSTTDMEVTSIRLERDLKERLKGLAKNKGYQALIRDILWNYVQQKSGDYRPSLAREDIRAHISAIAEQEETLRFNREYYPTQRSNVSGTYVSGRYGSPEFR